MGLFRKLPEPTTAEIQQMNIDAIPEHQASANRHAAIARLANAVGEHNTANAHRREAATQSVVARYFRTGRCQLGHTNCQDGDH